MWDQRMWVVKLGGSLHDAPDLRRWLRLLAQAPGCPRVLVPGGGPFAQAVRGLQPRLGFDDTVAHRMAILAMQQYALHLQALEPELALAETDEELRATPASVWLPWRLAGREPGLRASWELTSDSIACWLATRLGAELLLLVKSGAVPTGERAAADLAATGLVDPAFPALAGAFAGAVCILHRDHPPAALTERQLGPACRVVAQPVALASNASGSFASTTSRATR
jgi:aspartokinase-like uncharacterized kinase